MDNAQIVARATDARWDDGEFHDRLLLYCGEEGRPYLMKGVLSPTTAPAKRVSVVVRDEQDKGLRMYYHAGEGKWGVAGRVFLVGGETPRLNVVLKNKTEISARILRHAPEALLNRLSGHGAPSAEPERADAAEGLIERPRMR